MPRTGRVFTNEFKREVVNLAKRPGAVVTNVTKVLDSDRIVLRRWGSAERTILEKCVRLLCQGLAVRRIFIACHRDVWARRDMRRAATWLSVSKGPEAGTWR